MNLRFSKISIIIVTFMLLFASNANAQFSTNRYEKSELMFAIGGGTSVVDFSRMSALGGNISAELRKPVTHFGRSTSLSLNLSIVASIGNKSVTRKDDELGFFPAGFATVNINTFSQSTKIAKHRLGGFAGVGMIVMPSQSISYIKGEKEISEKSGLIGPAVMFGPRFRFGNVFMDLRAFGGVIFGGDNEMSYAGLNMMFTLGMGHTRQSNYKQ